MADFCLFDTIEEMCILYLYFNIACLHYKSYAEHLVVYLKIGVILTTLRVQNLMQKRQNSSYSIVKKKNTLRTENFLSVCLYDDGDFCDK